MYVPYRVTASLPRARRRRYNLHYKRGRPGRRRGGPRARSLARRAGGHADGAGGAEREQLVGQVLAHAPEFDLFAPQDSMGALGNSYQNASELLEVVRCE